MFEHIKDAIGSVGSRPMASRKGSKRGCVSPDGEGDNPEDVNPENVVVVSDIPMPSKKKAKSFVSSSSGAEKVQPKPSPVKSVPKRPSSLVDMLSRPKAAPVK